MGDRSEIEWTDATWNPVTGCSKVSAGCKHCYAERIFPRLHGREFNAITGEPRRFTDVLEHPSRLDKPLRWRRARKVFVNSLSDLFHEDVSDDFLDHVFAVMALARWHTFQILTKRPERMLRYMSHPHRKRAIAHAVMAISNIRAKRAGSHAARIKMADFEAAFPQGDTGPFKNVWLGVSVEDQATADERIPLLLQTPAAVRFVSAEPLLGAIDLDPLWLRPSPSSAAQSGRTSHLPLSHWANLGATSLDWIIVGGESGPNARPMHPDWARSLRDQCQAAGVAFFFKQWGEWTPGENVERSRGRVQVAWYDDGKWTYGTENLARDDGHRDDEPDVYRVGKKAAGRLLDGRIWHEFPRDRIADEFVIALGGGC